MKSHQVRTVLLALLLMATSYGAQAQSGTYSVDANGYYGNLVLNIDAAGTVSGSIYSNTQPIFGFYDQQSQKLVFYRTISPTNLSQNQVYEGYFWVEPAAQCGGAPNFTFHLAGSFQVFAGSGGTAARNRAGWTASFATSNCLH